MSTEAEKGNRDLYAVLELEPDATLDDIRRAFRAMAAKHHPDRHPGEANAALRFKQINAAYQVLSDPERRFQYDQLTAPVEDMAVEDMAALARRPPAPEEATRHQGPVTRKRRVRRRRQTGKMAWTLFVTAVGVTAAAAVIPDLRHEADKPPTTASTADDSHSRTEAAEARLAPVDDDVPPPMTTPGRIAPQPANPADDVPTRTVSGDRWSLDIPANWVDGSDARGPRYSSPAAIGTYRPSVRVEVTAFNGEAAKYFADLDKHVPHGVVIDSESWESDTSPDGLQREGHTISGTAIASRFLQYAVPSRGRGFVVTCDGPATGFDTARLLCARILGSLRIR